MKKLLTFSVALLGTVVLFAQEAVTDSTAVVQEEVKTVEQKMEYDRSSLSLLMVYHPEDEFGAAIDSAYHAMPFPDKYDEHNIGFERIDNSAITGVQKGNKIGLIKAQYGKKLNAKDLQKNSKALEDILNNAHIANYMIAKWFGLYEGQVCNMDLIKQRGQYNATEFDVAIANQSARGLAMLSDAGEQLIGNSYVLVNDMTYATAEERAQAAKIALGVIGGIFDAVMGTDLGSSFSSISAGNSSVRVVVPALTSSEKSSSLMLLSIPMPTTIQSISLKVALTSVNTPDILSPWIKTSFGHFILASRPNDLIDLAIATPVANVIKPIFAGGTWGLKMRDIHIPPSGASHFLPDLPLAFV